MAGVIADASPLIALHQIGQISLIEHLFDRILIPSAVAREVSPSLPTLQAWIMVRDLTQPIGAEILRASLGAGESDTLALALEVAASLVILDERPARKLALVLVCRLWELPVFCLPQSAQASFGRCVHCWTC